MAPKNSNPNTDKNQSETQHDPNRAVYRKTGYSEYDGNPCIEALPPIRTEQEFAEVALYLPEFHSDCRDLPTALRGHHLYTLFNLNVPTNNLLNLQQTISIVLRRGLIPRNPLSKNYLQRATILSSEVENSFKKDLELTGAEGQGNAENVVHYSRSTTLSVSVIGPSGCGKTTATNTILAEYPKVINHRRYGGVPFGHTQIVYLKIDTPPDGSIKQICLSILRSIDRLLGTQYYRDYGKNGRRTADELVGDIVTVASIHTIGMLVIDEIQNISAAKSGGSKKVMNFFVLLINTLNMPIVLIGTPLVYQTIGEEFRMTRRLAGQGDIVFGKFEKEEEWDYVLEAIWEYQYTKQIAPLTAELNNTLYHYSQGIIDILLKLFAYSQWRAIRSGKEMITDEIIHSIFHDRFQSLSPALDALRSGNITDLAAFPDIQPINISFHIKDSLLADHTAKLAHVMNAHRTNREKPNRSEIEVTEPDEVEILNSKSESESSQTDASKPSFPEANIDLVAEQVSDLNLVSVVKDGKAEGMNGYEALKEAGLICSPLEILEYME